MDSPNILRNRLLKFVRSVPLGKVVSYGQVAAHLGIQDARAIGWTLHALGAEKDFPWWRVLNNEGRITIKDEAGRELQKKLLTAEGVHIREDFRLDMEKYRHGKPSSRQRLF